MMKRIVALVGFLALGIGLGLAAPSIAQTVFRNYTSLTGNEIVNDQANPTGASFKTTTLGTYIFKITATTVGALPTCNTAATGLVYLVTDATTPTYLATISNGGSAVIPVVCNGTNWQAH